MHVKLIYISQDDVSAHPKHKQGIRKMLWFDEILIIFYEINFINQRFLEIYLELSHKVFNILVLTDIIKMHQLIHNLYSNQLHYIWYRYHY